MDECLTGLLTHTYCVTLGHAVTSTETGHHRSLTEVVSSRLALTVSNMRIVVGWSMCCGSDQAGHGLLVSVLLFSLRVPPEPVSLSHRHLTW